MPLLESVHRRSGSGGWAKAGLQQISRLGPSLYTGSTPPPLALAPQGGRENQGLVEWWESRQPSAFKDAIQFLILLPTSSGAVERFFSMAGTVTDAQHALSDNLRRMHFMAKFNGDIEERLV